MVLSVHCAPAHLAGSLGYLVELVLGHQCNVGLAAHLFLEVMYTWPHDSSIAPGEIMQFIS